MENKNIKQFTEAMKFDHPEDPTQEILVEAGDWYRINEDGTITLLSEEQVKGLEESTQKDDIKELNEEVDVKKVIKDFIETNWSKDEESAGKAMQLLSGLIHSEDPIAKKFISDLDKKSNEMNVGDYE